MQTALLAAVAIVPLFILPGFSFYYDVVPRLWFLLIAVALMLILRPGAFARISGFYASSRGRLFCWLLAGQAASLVLSAVFSSHPSLSFEGSTWRRFGVVPQFVLILLTLLLAADLLRGDTAVRRFLSANAIAGSIVAVYAILQYFGVDALQDPQLYRVGEGVWSIVRPTGTLGHADYLGVYLVLPLFAGLAMLHVHRRLGIIAIALSSTALALSGTRGAMLGAVAGLAAFVGLWRPRFHRSHAMLLAGIALAAASFYVSPSGTALRARVRWASEDLKGGARLHLWEDTVGMALHRPVVGYGPEIFVIEFPAFQSIDLARAYPDFFHESPHNVLLDTFASQGFIGLLLWVALVAFALLTGFQLARGRASRDAAVAVGALTALVCSQMFVAFTVATALCLYVVIAIVIVLSTPEPRPAQNRATYLAIPLALAVIAYACRIAWIDHRLATMRDSLASMDVVEATRIHQSAYGAGADLFYARSMARIASAVRDPLLSIQAAQQAIAGGEAALRTSEEPANAAYFLASQYAARNQMPETERYLRLARDHAPNWFKPHWMLAKVLVLQGRFDEACVEATLAADRTSAPEVAQTLADVNLRLRSAR